MPLPELPDWFEPAFLLLISLAVVHYAWVFYSTLFGKLVGLLLRLGHRPAARRTMPVTTDEPSSIRTLP